MCNFLHAGASKSVYITATSADPKQQSLPTPAREHPCPLRLRSISLTGIVELVSCVHARAYRNLITTAAQTFIATVRRFLFKTSQRHCIGRDVDFWAFFIRNFGGAKILGGIIFFKYNKWVGTISEIGLYINANV